MEPVDLSGALAVGVTPATVRSRTAPRGGRKEAYRRFLAGLAQHGAGAGAGAGTGTAAVPGVRLSDRGGGRTWRHAREGAGERGELFPVWRYHPFFTDSPAPPSRPSGNTATSPSCRAHQQRVCDLPREIGRSRPAGRCARPKALGATLGAPCALYTEKECTGRQERQGCAYCQACSMRDAPVQVAEQADLGILDVLRQLEDSESNVLSVLRSYGPLGGTLLKSTHSLSGVPKISCGFCSVR